MARRKEYRESKKMGSYDYSKKIAQTVTHDWTDGQEGAMKQEDNGSMGYYNRKGSLDRTDTKKLESDMLGQL